MDYIIVFSTHSPIHSLIDTARQGAIQLVRSLAYGHLNTWSDGTKKLVEALSFNYGSSPSTLSSGGLMSSK